jgi:predicted nucleic acid-binding protein
MEERIALEESLQLFTSIELNSHIAKITAYHLQRYHISLADAAIAATAKYLDVPLWTYNLKDFKQIPNLVVMQPQLPSSV